MRSDIGSNPIATCNFKFNSEGWKRKKIVIAEGETDNFIVRKIGDKSLREIVDKLRELIEEFGGDSRKNTDGKKCKLYLEVEDE